MNLKPREIVYNSILTCGTCHDLNKITRKKPLWSQSAKKSFNVIVYGRIWHRDVKFMHNLGLHDDHIIISPKFRWYYVFGCATAVSAAAHANTCTDHNCVTNTPIKFILAIAIEVPDYKCNELRGETNAGGSRLYSDATGVGRSGSHKEQQTHSGDGISWFND